MKWILRRLRRIKVGRFTGQIIGFSLATVIRNWMSLLRYECACFDPCVDPASEDFRGPYLYVFWHEYIPFMFYLRGHCDVVMLVSKHRDAEALASAAGIMGFELVRGSSRRGAIAALRGLISCGSHKNLTMTPDGPVGPRRHLAAGCVYVASRLGMPIVPIGMGYEKPWRNRRSWDQFAIPRPGTRACCILGPAIHIPKDLNANSLETWRAYLEEILNQLTDAAEFAADTGTPIVDSVPVRRQAGFSSDSQRHKLDRLQSIVAIELPR